MPLGRRIVAALWLAGLVTQAAGQVIFTCVDSKGRRITADRPIAECNDREQNQITPSGKVVRKVGPSLTAAERAAEEEQQRKAIEERNRQLDEKKRDRALVARFPDKPMHDKERALALSKVDEVMATAQKHTADLAKQRKRIETDIEFYKADPSKVPLALKRELEVNQQEMDAQKRFMANQEEEKRRLNTRFDEELVRLKQLWAQRAAPPQVPAVSPPVPAGR